MAVKVTVYGTANMRQITAARAELDRLEKQATINAGGFRGAMTRMSDAATRTGEKMSAVGSSMTRNLTLPIAALGAGLYKATEAAAEDAKAQTVLASTLKNTAGATSASVKQTEDWISKQGKLLGVADDALRPALATLATATKDVTKAQSLASTAMDLAAAKGIPVEKAATAIAKAYSGQFGSLQRLIPGIDAAAIKNKDFGAVMDSVNKIVGGQAAAAANTEAGARQKANVALQESVEKLGTAFMPIMQQVTKLLTEQVVPVITRLADWFGKLDSGQKQLVIGVGIFLAALGPVVSVVGKVVQVVGLLSKAMLFLAANPVGAIITVVALLVIGLITLWNTNEGFRKAVINIWNAIVKFFQQAVAFITDIFMNWTIWGLLIKNWDKIVGAVKTAWNGIVAFLQKAAAFIVDIFMNWTIWGFLIKNWNKIVVAVQTAWNKVIGFFQQAPGRILKALGDVGSMLYNTGKNIVTGLWKGIQDTWGNVMNWIGGLFNGFIDKVKGLLGIASPSKVFAGIGNNLSKGLQNGILGGVPAVQGAMDKLAGITTGSLNASMTLDAGRAFAAAGPNSVLASAASSVSNSSVITVAPGAVQVSVAGGGDPANVGTAVQDAFAQ